MYIQTISSARSHQITLCYPVLILGRTARHECGTVLGATQIRGLHIDLASNAIAVNDRLLVVSSSAKPLVVVVVLRIIVLIDVFLHGTLIAGPHLYGVDGRKCTTSRRCRSAGRRQFTWHSHTVPDDAEDDTKLDERYGKGGGQEPHVLLAIPDVQFAKASLTNP